MNGPITSLFNAGTPVSLYQGSGMAPDLIIDGNHSPYTNLRLQEFKSRYIAIGSSISIFATLEKASTFSISSFVNNKVTQVVTK